MTYQLYFFFICEVNKTKLPVLKSINLKGYCYGFMLLGTMDSEREIRYSAEDALLYKTGYDAAQVDAWLKQIIDLEVSMKISMDDLVIRVKEIPTDKYQPRKAEVVILIVHTTEQEMPNDKHDGEPWWGEFCIQQMNLRNFL